MFLKGDWTSYTKLASDQMAAIHSERRLVALNAARRAETVVQHEGWQFFLDHLQGMLDLAKQRFEHERDQALDDASHATFAREHRERIRTLQEVMELIPRIVESGKPLVSSVNLT